MRKTLTTLSAAALAVTMAMPAQAQDQAEEMELDTVVATVNGEDITLGHMLMVRTTLPEQYQQLGDDVLWDGILDQLVRQAALAQDENAVETKLAAIRRNGAVLHLCAPTIAAREAGAARIQAETGAHLVHPYTNPFVIAGQGTIGKEILEQHTGAIEAIFVPVGGGGLAAGVAHADHEAEARHHADHVEADAERRRLAAAEALERARDGAA